MGLFVGVDGGASKTHVVVVRDDGTTVLDITQPGTSYTILGYQALQGVLTTLRDAVLAGISGHDANPIWVLGLPGYHDFPRRTSELDRVVEPVFTAYRYKVLNDVTLAHHGALAGEPGVVASSGTGSLVLGIDADGLEVRCGGWGPLVGDEGSAYSIGIAALRAISHMTDGRLAPTPLGTQLLKALESNNLADALERLESEPHDKRQIIASLALVVDDAAQAGDPIAQSLIDAAAHAMAQQVKAVVAQVDTLASGPVAYAGGTFRSKLMQHAFAEHLISSGLPAPTPPNTTAAAGGADLARHLRDL